VELENGRYVYPLHALTRTSEMCLIILNFLTEILIIEGNPQTLPQIRIEIQIY
jgi:hypothetical protein